MWTSPPTAQGKRGLDQPLFNLSQRRPGTKLSVAAAPADGRVTKPSSRVGGRTHRAARGRQSPAAYEVVLAWERGAWDEVSLAAARLGLRSEEIAARYQSALKFGNSVALVEGGRPARV